MDVSLKWSFQLPSPVLPLEPGQVWWAPGTPCQLLPLPRPQPRVSDRVLLQLEPEADGACFFCRSRVSLG